ncbi:MAG: hypothetical protein AB7V19_00775 [Candidatus Bipolaricaulia bacterium]
MDRTAVVVFCAAVLTLGVAVADFNLDGRVDVALAVGIAGTPAPSRVWLGSENGFTDSGVRTGDGLRR